MSAFHVWDPDDGDESDARIVEATDPEGAASRYAERYDRDDWAEDMTRTYRVRGDGETWDVDVTLALVASYRAGEPRPVP